MTELMMMGAVAALLVWAEARGRQSRTLKPHAGDYWWLRVRFERMPPEPHLTLARLFEDVGQVLDVRRTMHPGEVDALVRYDVTAGELVLGDDVPAPDGGTMRLTGARRTTARGD